MIYFIRNKSSTNRFREKFQGGIMMAKNIFRSMGSYFRRKISGIKEGHKSKMDIPYRLCTFTQEEYYRFSKISRENDKFAG